MFQCSRKVLKQISSTQMRTPTFLESFVSHGYLYLAIIRKGELFLPVNQEWGHLYVVMSEDLTSLVRDLAVRGEQTLASPTWCSFYEFVKYRGCRAGPSRFLRNVWEARRWNEVPSSRQLLGRQRGKLWRWNLSGCGCLMMLEIFGTSAKESCRRQKEQEESHTDTAEKTMEMGLPGPVRAHTTAMCPGYQTEMRDFTSVSSSFQSCFGLILLCYSPDTPF